MHDNRIYDAINLYKFSPTGQGTVNVGGGRMFQAKYQRLAKAVVEKLWLLWGADEIGFHNLGNSIGTSKNQRPGHDIRVNKLIEPSAIPASYQDPMNQGKLAATSCNIVHEAVHLVRDIGSYPEEELLCRTLQLSYFRDLISPRSYQSRFANARCTAAFLPTTPYFDDYQFRLNHLHDLIDTVLDMEEYRRDLESDRTAEFISWAIGWWGGLSMRWPSTRGYFLRSLASREDRDFRESILQILESLTRQQWQAAKTVAGDLQKIRRRLEVAYLSHPFVFRIMQVQTTLGENFGIRA
jgi:hypothetical protein